MTPRDDTLSRRQALATVGAAAIAGAGLSLGTSTTSGSGLAHARESADDASVRSARAPRMPTLFLPHGGGPWPFIDPMYFGAPGMWDTMAAFMRGLGTLPPIVPRAILVISAHWEASVPTVMTAPKPPMLYDYSGFPAEAYRVQWPAPGHPGLAAEVRAHLEAQGIRSASDARRGFDHGTFVPLKLAYPDAAIPTIQLSLTRGLDPREHLAVGQALTPLRDAGVFIIGSGMSYHNMGHFMRSLRGGATRVVEDSKTFDAWLAESVSLGSSEREARLAAWEKAPAARACHPREEHLLPLMVVAGAAGEDPGTLPYRDVVMNAHISAVQFG